MYVQLTQLGAWVLFLGSPVLESLGSWVLGSLGPWVLGFHAGPVFMVSPSMKQIYVLLHLKSRFISTIEAHAPFWEQQQQDKCTKAAIL